MSMPQRRFDSLHYVKELKKVGFTEQQAETLSAIAEDQSLTKQDLKQTELKLTLEIQEVRREIKEVEARLTLEMAEVRREIKEVEARLTLKIKELEVKIDAMETRIVFRLTKTMVILFGLSIGLIGFMIKLIH